MAPRLMTQGSREPGAGRVDVSVDEHRDPPARMDDEPAPRRHGDAACLGFPAEVEVASDVEVVLVGDLETDQGMDRPERHDPSDSRGACRRQEVVEHRARVADQHGAGLQVELAHVEGERGLVQLVDVSGAADRTCRRHVAADVRRSARRVAVHEQPGAVVEGQRRGDLGVDGLDRRHDVGRHDDIGSCRDADVGVVEVAGGRDHAADPVVGVGPRGAVTAAVPLIGGHPCERADARAGGSAAAVRSGVATRASEAVTAAETLTRSRCWCMFRSLSAVATTGDRPIDWSLWCGRRGSRHRRCSGPGGYSSGAGVGRRRRWPTRAGCRCRGTHGSAATGHPRSAGGRPARRARYRPAAGCRRTAAR